MSPNGHRVIFHRLAGREAKDAWRRYAGRSLRRAQRFKNALDAAVSRIACNPSLGSPFLQGFRWTRVGKFPYLLYYREVVPGVVRIYAVAHAARRPGYWLRRAYRP